MTDQIRLRSLTNIRGQRKFKRRISYIVCGDKDTFTEVINIQRCSSCYRKLSLDMFQRRCGFSRSYNRMRKSCNICAAKKMRLKIKKNADVYENLGIDDYYIVEFCCMLYKSGF
jgi:hypothetical protein